MSCWGFSVEKSSFVFRIEQKVRFVQNVRNSLTKIFPKYQLYATLILYSLFLFKCSVVIYLYCLGSMLWGHICCGPHCLTSWDSSDLRLGYYTTLRDDSPEGRKLGISENARYLRMECHAEDWTSFSRGTRGLFQCAAGRFLSGLYSECADKGRRRVSR